MSTTEKTLADLQTITKLVADQDPHILKQVLKDVSGCINRSSNGKMKRLFDEEDIIAMCKMSIRDRLIKCKKIFNREVVEYCLAENQLLMPDKKKLLAYPNLKEGVKALYGQGDMYNRAEEVFNQQVTKLKEDASWAEQFRKQEIIGKKAGTLSIKPKILVCLKISPVGAKRAPWNAMYDLFMHYLGIGKYGELLTTSDLQERITAYKKDYHVKQHPHPSRQLL